MTLDFPGWVPFEDEPMAFVTDNAGYPSIFMDKAIDLVCEKYNRDILDVGDTPPLTPTECYIVWFSKTLQNWKALVSTDRSDGRYYELTYNGDKKESYVDVYRKVATETITDESR